MTKSNRILAGMMILFHLIGLGLFVWDSQYASLTPLNIMFCFAVLLVYHSFSKPFLITSLIIYFLGITVEIVGVNTGLLFGEYSYGSSMGPMIFSTPVIIGVNWICVVTGAYAISRYIGLSRFLTIIIGALLATILDFVIEPVAIQYDLWNWTDGEIPVYNYLCWFFFSSLFIFWLTKFNFNENAMGRVLYITWLSFFTILNFI